MRDAIGGTFSLQIILFFLVVINAYLAFSVNYTKAFRIKNNIIAIIEQQEGYTTSNSIGEESAQTRIFALMERANYTIDQNNLSCDSGYTKIYDNTKNTGFCLRLRKNEDGSGYYSVTTFINIDIPVLNRLFPIFRGAFAINGETKTIYSDKLVDLE